MTKTALEVPADPRFRHVIAATVLTAVRVFEEPRADLGQMGDLSLLLDRALDQIDRLAGVTRLVVEVDPASASVTVIGEGEEIERPAWASQSVEASFLDPITGSSFEWNPTAIQCSLRIASGVAPPT
jgi:hypothetical protein